MPVHALATARPEPYPGYAVGHGMDSPADMPWELSPGAVKRIHRDNPSTVPGSVYGAHTSGYGAKIPTAYRVTLADNRARRVYVINYGNSGSAYVLVTVDGITRRAYLDIDTDYSLRELAPGTSRPVWHATRVTTRFYEYVNPDGSHDPIGSEDTFNIDATPHYTDITPYSFTSVSELVATVKRDYVTFDATGSDYASNPDGSDIIDYATAERETVSWHFDASIPVALMSRVIIPAIDKR